MKKSLFLFGFLIILLASKSGMATEPNDRLGSPDQPRLHTESICSASKVAYSQCNQKCFQPWVDCLRECEGDWVGQGYSSCVRECDEQFAASAQKCSNHCICTYLSESCYPSDEGTTILEHLGHCTKNMLSAPPPVAPPSIGDRP